MIHGAFQFVLLADIGEVIGSLIGLVMLVLWVIQRIFEANKAMAPRPKVPAAAPQPQPVAAEGPPQAGQQADPLRQQVEEFLRRAGQGQQQPNQVRRPPRQPAPPGAKVIEVLVDEGATRRERAPLAEPPRPKVSNLEASDTRPPRRPVTPRKRKSLAERADERAAQRTRAIAEQASHLGERIVQEDQRFDTALKAKFDHSVGTLAGRETPPADVPAATSDSPAAQIAAMLASPDGVRQAIVLNEILRRPSDRW